jgi:hypothetical protein
MNLIVVKSSRDCSLDIPEVSVVPTQSYRTGRAHGRAHFAKVLNLRRATATSLPATMSRCSPKCVAISRRRGHQESPDFCGLIIPDAIH